MDKFYLLHVFPTPIWFTYCHLLSLITSLVSLVKKNTSCSLPYCFNHYLIPRKRCNSPIKRWMHLLILDSEVSRCTYTETHLISSRIAFPFNSFTPLARTIGCSIDCVSCSIDSLKVANYKHCLLTYSFEEETYQSLVVHSSTGAYFYFDVI